MKKARKINIPEKHLKELKNHRMNSKEILRHLESVGKKNDIVVSNIQKIKTGVAMIRNAKATLKELADKNQLSLIKEEADIYDLAMKLKV